MLTNYIDNKDTFPQLFILALSGHASSIFDAFFKSSQIYSCRITAIQSQWDNGGHTGFLSGFYRWFSKNNNMIFRGLKLFIPPPMGDLKTQISRHLFSLAEARHSNKVIEKLAKLFAKKTKLDLLNRDVEDFFKTLESYLPGFFSDQDKKSAFFLLNQYKKYSLHKDKYFEVSHSVGNLFLAYLFIHSQIHKKRFLRVYGSECDHKDIFFALLKKLDFIPYHVRQEFLCESGVTISALDQNKKKVEGELNFDMDKIDHPHVVFGERNRLNVETYTFHTDKINEAKARVKFKSIISQNPIVIIPPGSVSNWMPMVNKYKVLMKKYAKKIIWIPNCFCHISEQDIEVQYSHLFKLFDRKLYIICPLHNAFENLGDRKEAFLKAYQEQHKREANIAFLFDKPNVEISINYQILEPGEGGIKYDQLSISKILLNEIF